jgi:hypothetical protein
MRKFEEVMLFDDRLLKLMGLTFAHAAWSMSDLSEGELLVPLAFTQQSGERQLLRFEADSQEEAIANGKSHFASSDHEYEGWAFARDGVFRIDATVVDALTVEANGYNSESSVLLIQPYQPFAAGKFELLGIPKIAIDGQILEAKDAASLINQIMLGVNEHEPAAEQWSDWLTLEQ